MNDENHNDIAGNIDLETAKKLEKDAYAAYEAKEFKNAADLFEQAAQYFVKAEQWEHAAQHFHYAAARLNESGEARDELKEADLYEQAAQYFVNAEQWENAAINFYDVAVCFENLDENKRATQYFERAGDCLATNTREKATAGKYYAGKYYNNAGKFALKCLYLSDAVRLYRKAVACFPKPSKETTPAALLEAWFSLGQACLDRSGQLAAHDPERKALKAEGERYLKRCQAIAATHAVSPGPRAELHAMIGAIRVWEAHKLAGEPALENDSAEIAEKAGRIDDLRKQAKQEFASSLALIENLPELRETDLHAEVLGESAHILRQENHFNQARNNYLAAATIYRRDHDPNRHRRLMDAAICLWNMGKHSPAFQELESLLEEARLPDIRHDILYAMARFSISKGIAPHPPEVYFHRAIAITEQQLSHFTTYEDIFALLNQRHDAYHDLILYYCDNERFEEAFETVERIKSRYLSAMVQVREVGGEENYRLLMQRKEAMKQAEAGEAHNKEAAAAAREAYQAFIREIRATVNPALDPDRETPVTAADVIGHIRCANTAVISFYPLRDQLLVFILNPLTQLTAFATQHITYSQLNRWCGELPALMQDRKYVARMARSGSANEDQATYGAQQEDTDKRWRQAMYTVLMDLGKAWVPELKAHLPHAVNRLILVPYGILHMIPFHAATWWNDGVRDSVVNRQNVHLCDLYTIGYAPSCRILLHTLDALETSHAPDTLPRPWTLQTFSARHGQLNDIPMVDMEAGDLARRFNRDIVAGPMAMADTLAANFKAAIDEGHAA